MQQLQATHRLNALNLEKNENKRVSLQMNDIVPTFQLVNIGYDGSSINDNVTNSTYTDAQETSMKKIKSKIWCHIVWSDIAGPLCR